MLEGPAKTDSERELEGRVEELTAQFNALKERFEFYRNCINNVSDLVVVYDRAGRIHRVNDAGCGIVGYTKEQFKAMNLLDLIEGDEDVAKNLLMEVFEQGYDPNKFSTVRIHGGDGNGRYLKINLRLLPNQPEDAMLCGRDISSRLELERELQWLAVTDELIGLYNRRYFFNECSALSKGDNGVESSYLLMIDLNDFKELNDYLGHVVGDYVMKHFANVLRDTVREGDPIISRYGGDEFAILLKKISLEKAIEVAERIGNAMESHKPRLPNKVSESDIRKAIEQGICDRDGSINIRFAIGISYFAPGDDNYGLPRADDAMRDAKETSKKNGGRSCFMVYPIDSATAPVYQ